MIEVQDEEQRCFFEAKLIDVQGEQYFVQLGGGEDAAQQRWVRWDLVREAQRATGDFSAAPEDLVEVKCFPDGESAPPTWFEAQVKVIKGEFIKIVFTGAAGGEEVLDGNERLRPCSTKLGRTKPAYVRQSFPVADPQVFDWFVQSEARLAQDVCAKSGIVAFSLERRSSQVKMLGTEKAIDKAKMLVDLHGRHMNDMQRMHTEREVLASKLKVEKEKIETGQTLEFSIERELIGLIFGKGGRAIADAKKMSGVDYIKVTQAGSQPLVTVVGPTQESVEAARELLEFVTEHVPVLPEQVGWLIGRGGRNFKDLQDKTKVTRLNVDKIKSQVVLVGTRTAVEAAKLYIETHLQFLSEFESERGESEKLRKELRGIGLGEESTEYEPSGRAYERAGRGSGRGRGRGGSNGSLMAGGRGRDDRVSSNQEAGPLATAQSAEPTEGGRGRGGTGRGGRRGSGPGRGGRDGGTARGGGGGRAPAEEGSEPPRPRLLSGGRPGTRPASDTPNGDVGGAEGAPQRPANARRSAGRPRPPRKEGVGGVPHASE